MNNSVTSLKGFIPFDLLNHNGVAKLYWFSADGFRMREPFYDNDIRRHLNTEGVRIRESEMRELLQFAGNENRSIPKLLIFHMSRCGSTILTNMFRSDNRNVCVSEPEILDKIADFDTDDTKPYISDLMYGAMSALAQNDWGAKNLIIKFPSYSVISLKWFVSLFPRVPRIFVYRDPVEVLISNLKQPWQEWIYDKRLTKLDEATMLQSASVAENCARALANKCWSYLAYHDRYSLVVNYEQINKQGFKKILDFVGMDYSDSEFTSMLGAMKTNAKTGNEFVRDSSQKQNEASDFIRSIADKILYPAYNKLESCKMSL